MPRTLDGKKDVWRPQNENQKAYSLRSDVLVLPRRSRRPGTKEIELPECRSKRGVLQPDGAHENGETCRDETTDGSSSGTL